MEGCGQCVTLSLPFSPHKQHQGPKYEKNVPFLCHIQLFFLTLIFGTRISILTRHQRERYNQGYIQTCHQERGMRGSVSLIAHSGRIMKPFGVAASDHSGLNLHD